MICLMRAKKTYGQLYARGENSSVMSTEPWISSYRYAVALQNHPILAPLHRHLNSVLKQKLWWADQTSSLHILHKCWGVWKWKKKKKSRKLTNQKERTDHNIPPWYSISINSHRHFKLRHFKLIISSAFKRVSHRIKRQKEEKRKRRKKKAEHTLQKTEQPITYGETDHNSLSDE